jgi:hypothetical protein
MVHLSLYCSLYYKLYVLSRSTSACIAHSIISYMSYHGPPVCIAHSIISYMSYHELIIEWAIQTEVDHDRTYNL